MRGFVPFGPDHQAVLVATAVIAVALVLSRRHLRQANDRWVRRVMAAGLMGNELVAWGISAAHGQVWLPLQLCDLALFATAWALIRPQWLVAELAYFWGLAGSLQAVLTPDLREPFPSYWWVRFFLGHCGIVLSAVYLAAKGWVQPTARSVWRVWLLTNGYAAVAGMANWMFGTNYGYLARKPMHPSLLDHLGPWPYYILGMELAALVSFYLSYTPFVLARWLQRRTT
jgi:hypothetical integral membrane protein (TIGR02206 family)